MGTRRTAVTRLLCIWGRSARSKNLLVSMAGPCSRDHVSTFFRLDLTEHLGGGGLDASLLALPLRRAGHAPQDGGRPRRSRSAWGRASYTAIYRWNLRTVYPDMRGRSFCAASGWWITGPSRDGRMTHWSCTSRCVPDPGRWASCPRRLIPPRGAFLANYPQAFSHIGVISSGVNLARHLHQMENNPAR